jgi:hypothetical protein
MVDYFDSNGYAVVKQDGKYGLINSDGEFVVPCIYEKMSKYTKGSVVEVRLNGKWGVVDLSNNTIVEPIYDEVFVDGNYIVVTIGGKTGCIGFNNKAGINIPCKYDKLGEFQEETSYAVACLNGKYGIIDTQDNTILPYRRHPYREADHYASSIRGENP